MASRTATLGTVSAVGAVGAVGAVPASSTAVVDTASINLERGSLLGSYQLVLPIASGGMGHVWIAARRGDFGFQRMFAVKVMREEIAKDARLRRMFLDEAKLAARLRHSNVLEVLDLGEVAGTVYQAMPLVDGDSLAGLVARDRCRDAKMPVEIAGRIVVDALRGLHAAHELKDELGMPLHLVHRDVSPGNILVGLDGLSKIADFGVAKAIGLSDSSGLVGKRSYMPPEQLLGEELDRRSDVFATGVVLWELLVGRRIVSPASELLAGCTIPDPRSIREDAHGGLALVAMRALERRPADRYPSADAMADAIERVASECGMALSAKAVGAWVSELVGARASQLRSEARREFEVSQALERESETEDREIGTEGGLLTITAPAPRARRALGALAVALVLAGVVGGGVIAFGGTRREGERGLATTSTPAKPAAPSPEAASAISPSLSLPALAPEVAPDVTARSSAASAVIAVPRARAARPPPTRPRAAAPSPSYDNPYEH